MLQQNPKWRLVVIVDCDNENCKELKKQLECICNKARLSSKTKCKNPNWNIVTRIAIKELEAWYFGDWAAVKAAYPKISANAPRIPPDQVVNAWETFHKILRQKKYFLGGLNKGQAAAEIGRHIDARRSRSPSFKKLYCAIEEAVEAMSIQGG